MFTLQEGLTSVAGDEGHIAIFQHSPQHLRHGTGAEVAKLVLMQKEGLEGVVTAELGPGMLPQQGR